MPTSFAPFAREVEIEVGGMSCTHCVDAVSASLARVPGVSLVRVSIGSAHIAVADDAAVARALAAIADAGYTSRGVIDARSGLEDV